MPERPDVPPSVAPPDTADPHPTRCQTPFPGGPDTPAPPTADPGGPGQPPATDSPGGSASPGRAGRYELLGEIGRGGMGLVLKARDPELGRDLALKVLLDRHAGEPAVAQRFREEAQIGGQLAHPGVVPVHELAAFEDGRPFFTMKLVKGQTLSTLLGERSDPSQDRPRFLKVFEQVCQTVAFAHSRRVIHRDLKPSNMMVGAFGEVLVMDWGLAKVLASGGRSPPEDATPPAERT